MFQQIDEMLNYGSRDMLLIKCKTAIEELHIELKASQEQKEQMQKDMNILEEINVDNGKEIQRIKRESEKKSEVINQINERNSLLECLKDKYGDCKGENDKLSYENQQLNYEISELHGAIKKKEQLEMEWENTIRIIQKRIAVLEKENDELKFNQTQFEKFEEVQSELMQAKEALEKEKQDNNRLKKEINLILQVFHFKFLKQIKQYSEAQNQQSAIQQNYEKELNSLRKQQMMQLEQSNEQASKNSEKQQQQYKELQYEYNESIINLNKIKNQLELEISEHMKEKELLHERINELSRLVNKNEDRINDMNRNYIEKNQYAQKTYASEMAKLQAIIDDQAKLIESFESIMEKEKIQFIENIENLNSENNLQKVQINDLANKNHFLQMQANQAQDELNQVSQMLMRQEDNQKNAGNHIAALEKKLDDANKTIEEKNLELKKSKLDQQKTLGQIKILMKDLEQITNEVYSKEQQYKQVKQENELLKQNRSELNKIIYQQFDQLGQSSQKQFLLNQNEVTEAKKFKQFEVLPNRQSFKSFDVHPFSKEKQPQNDFYKTVTKKIPDFNNSNKPLEGYGQEKEKKFLDKFRNIITNLEDKLEYMQNELNSSQ